MKYHIQTAGKKYCVEAPTIEAAQIKWIRDFEPKAFGMFVQITPEGGVDYWNLPEHILEMAGYVKEDGRYVLKGIRSYEHFKEPPPPIEEDDDEPFVIAMPKTDNPDWGRCPDCGTTLRRGQIHNCGL